ncbi:MAG: purine-binding chemotaxis protein CheW [Alphaproteobacteria bacterium]|nr:MAG: purine-binding chemotaxis protein CheW [Alphaproteobacteria bacterium]
MQQATIEPVSNDREILAFHVREQDFCIDIGHVREIRGYSKTTALPHTPDHVVGVINLRGNVIPVIDLSLRLGMEPTTPTPRHVIIITDFQEMTTGLLVEGVSDINSVSAEQMRQAPELAADGGRKFIEGVYVFEDRLIRALDLKALLASDGDME